MTSKLCGQNEQSEIYSEQAHTTGILNWDTRAKQSNTEQLLMAPYEISSTFKHTAAISHKQLKTAHRALCNVRIYFANTTSEHCKPIITWLVQPVILTALKLLVGLEGLQPAKVLLTIILES